MILSDVEGTEADDGCIICYNFHQKEVTMKAKYQEDGTAYHNHYKNNVFRNFRGTLNAATVL